MRLARLGCVLILGAAVVAAWASVSSPQFGSGRKEVRVGAVGIPSTLDPAAALDGAAALIARQVFDTLVSWQEGSADIEPALATRWTVSRDGLTWSFTLRDNVRFHDGTALTAGEVAASFDHHLKDTQRTPVVWTALLRGAPGVVEEVRAADARTVQFVLVQPYAPLLTVLAHPGFGIARQVAAADGSVRFIGTGPYRLTDASSGRMTLDTVAGHWAGAPRAERLIFLEVANDDHAEAEFDARALDMWFPAGAPRRNEGAFSVPGIQVGYLAFQTEKEPFSRKKIRQALAAAIDPAAVGAALGRTAVPPKSFLPAGTWARREGSPILGGTRRAVTMLLAEGGWPKGYAPTLLAPSELPGFDVSALAEALKTTLQAADIPVRVRLEPDAALRTARGSGEHDIALAEASIAGGDPHLFLYPLSTSEGASKGPQALNFSFYRNPRLDDMLIRASQIGFRPERQRLYQRAQAVLSEELPWLPLYVRLLWAVVRPEVKGLRLQPTGFHRLPPLRV